jgi:coenzyme F420-0:L-glutamate ligase/coenzyme F420-1:gamma-L-glutamate ligase
VTPGPLAILPVVGVERIARGTSIAEAGVRACTLLPGDVLTVAGALVAEAEGRRLPCDDSATARAEIVERTATRILRRFSGGTIAEGPSGLVTFDGGIDFGDAGSALLPPVDPDRSARRIGDGIGRVAGVEVAVIVTARVPRPWRRGLVAVAAGTWRVATFDGSWCVADALAASGELAHPPDAPGITVLRGVEGRLLGADQRRVRIPRPAVEELFR